jgi:PleD family two-component response regulator
VIAHGVMAKLPVPADVFVCAEWGRAAGSKIMKVKKTTLCVDDHEQSLSIRKLTLETRGYRVIVCTTGEEACANRVRKRVAGRELDSQVSRSGRTIFTAFEVKKEFRLKVAR